jgi:hypothetical protein
MTAQGKGAQSSEATPQRSRIDRGIIGVMLVAIGLIALAANIWGLELIGLLVLPLLGVMFLVWAFSQRRAGLVIPGGILVGLGLGALAQQTLFFDVSEEARGAIVVLGLALGFLMIIPLTPLAGGHAHWWPVIPGFVLAGVALAMFAGPGGVAILQALNILWPIALIVVGVYLLWMMYRPRSARGRGRRGLPS